MTVHFIGAGPGRRRPDHGAGPRCSRAVRSASTPARSCRATCWRRCPPGAALVDTAPLDLDAIVAEIAAAHARGIDVARLQSGDLSICSALGEQLRRLERLGIPYTLTPGVPAFAAAAAALGRELTVPEVAQIVVLTRTSGRASAMPDGETLAAFAATGATLAIHLSIHALDTGRGGAAAALRRRLPGGGRLARVLAGRARPRAARSASCRAGGARRASSARR